MNKLPQKTRLTQQRKTILDIVKSTCYHPTAEQIFKLVKKQLPKISVGTVYRNLDVLADQKLIKRIDIPGEPTRFDAELKNKAYFVCKNKGSIYDLKIDSEKLKSLVNCDCIDKIDDFHILLFGTSKDCPSEKGLRKGQLKR
ncbi:transcriptional repressor [Candidatus Pacearchaeota archaeon]|nr:transcriptional repressor [Candidatus Pacearchaeota archaeon]